MIPAFLNPLDDRKTWKGYPLQGLALTHFVGMAGIEDARNVVAATLPRSDPRAGVFGYDEVATPEQITDGTSQTIMVMGSGTMANPWIMGGGATVRGAREPYFDKVSGFGTRNLREPGGAGRHGRWFSPLHLGQASNRPSSARCARSTATTASIWNAPPRRFCSTAIQK